MRKRKVVDAEQLAFITAQAEHKKQFAIRVEICRQHHDELLRRLNAANYAIRQRKIRELGYLKGTDTAHHQIMRINAAWLRWSLWRFIP